MLPVTAAGGSGGGHRRNSSEPHGSSAVRVLVLSEASSSSWSVGGAAPAAAPAPHAEEEARSASVKSEHSERYDLGESATGPTGREELRKISAVAAQRFSAAKAGWRLQHGHGRTAVAACGADCVAAELSKEDLSTAGVGAGPESFEHV